MIYIYIYIYNNTSHTNRLQIDPFPISIGFSQNQNKSIVSFSYFGKFCKSITSLNAPQERFYCIYIYIYIYVYICTLDLVYLAAFNSGRDSCTPNVPLQPPPLAWFYLGTAAWCLMLDVSDLRRCSMLSGYSVKSHGQLCPKRIPISI